VIGPRGVVAIDAPTLPGDALAWRREIADLTDLPIVYTVLTDAHPHRLLCAALFEATIVASRAAYQQAADYSRGFWRNVVRRLRRSYPAQAEAMRTLEPQLPSILFTDALTLHKAGTDVRLEKVAGPSPGSSWVKLNNPDTLFLGDTVVVGVPPILEECPDTKAWLDTLTALRRPHVSDITLVPGRGPLADQAATEAVSEYIRLARRRVRSLHRKAKSREEVIEHVDELLSVFSLSEAERPRFRRRARNGLKQVYDELAPDEDSG
jgi:glyoxylase-like metal-dependent hydrolase (beta-lactamase superfamily II)